MAATKDTKKKDAADYDSARSAILPAGGSVARHDMNASGYAPSGSRISIRVRGFTWSTTSPVVVEPSSSITAAVDSNTAAGGTTHTTTLHLHDECEETLEVTVQLLLSSSGTVRCELFVPYWIINRTFRPLLFASEISNASSAAMFNVAPGQSATRRLMEELQTLSEKKRTTSTTAATTTTASAAGRPCSRLLSAGPGPSLGVLDLLPPASKRIVRAPLLFSSTTTTLSLRSTDTAWSEG